jgi:PPK2 family polyphosphate:nucleotide phosphotransferase
MSEFQVSEKFQVPQGDKLSLAKHAPDYPGQYEKDKNVLKEEVRGLVEKIAELQPRLYAEHRQSLLVVLQAMDTGGKDSTIRDVFSDINPQGCTVHSFKVPTELELSHHFLWRVMQKVPAKGYIAVFNRSHYEDVLVTRVHGLVSDKLAERRFKEIREFEKMLLNQGTRILKFFLNISKEEQKKRLEDRLEDPKKHWKFNPADLSERAKWHQYQKYYEAAIQATSTQEAPWYIIPANHKWFRNQVVAQVVLATLKKMNPQFPPMPKSFDPKKIIIP